MTTKTPIREAAIAQAYDRSTIEIKLGADHGELLSAETVGGVITNAAKLFKLAAKECGYKAEVLVRSIEYKDGEMRDQTSGVSLGKGTEKAGEERTGSQDGGRRSAGQPMPQGDRAVSENGFIKWRNYWMAAAFTLMGTTLTGMTE